MEIVDMITLTVQDRRTSMFTPLGLMGVGTMPRETQLKVLQEEIAMFDLIPAVPNEVRSYYEVARRLHVFGCFEYRFFALADERATFAVEFALRWRLVDWYERRVPIRNKSGDEAVIEVEHPWQFDERYRAKRRAKGGWHLAGFDRFDNSLASLIEWANSTLRLGPYFERRPNSQGELQGRLDGLLALRNLAAHPSSDILIGPPDSARGIQFSWRLINALWGLPATDRWG